MKKTLLTMTAVLALFSFIALGSISKDIGGMVTPMEHGVGHG
ncbi:hypothetical protein [Paenibacillus wynnii]|nr:hypothetical protein [Paenibacillus wynnii]